MPSKLNIKRKKLINSGWYYYKYENDGWYAFHENWHPFAEHIRFPTERDLINKMYKLSLPEKPIIITVSYGNCEVEK